MCKKIFILDDDFEHCLIFKNQLENSGKGYKAVSPETAESNNKLLDAIKEFFNPSTDSNIKSSRKTEIETYFNIDIDGFILDYELKDGEYSIYNSQKFYAKFIKDNVKLNQKPVFVMTGVSCTNQGKKDAAKFNKSLIYNHLPNVYTITSKWNKPECLGDFLNQCNQLFIPKLTDTGTQDTCTEPTMSKIKS